eukprot:SAG31_NODE_3314_length_4427_cov_3.391174_7_plen_118_part_00
MRNLISIEPTMPSPGAWHDSHRHRQYPKFRYSSTSIVLNIINKKIKYKIPVLGQQSVPIVRAANPKTGGDTRSHGDSHISKPRVSNMEAAAVEESLDKLLESVVSVTVNIGRLLRTK